ncbi:MAG: hypothetical protein QMC85_05665 [Methanocellales archaeon]|nr:hypothetical protein [Methanocellales archaeon]MDI6859962.1 hypothetical protein [Methanocellales archaeon]
MKFEVYPKWRGRLVLPSLTAYHELGDLKLDLHDVVEILEHGEDCSKTKRKLSWRTGRYPSTNMCG